MARENLNRRKFKILRGNEFIFKIIILGPGSRSSSTSSLSSIASDVRCSVPTISTNSTTGGQGRYYSDTELVKTNQANNKPLQNNQNNKSRNIILTGKCGNRVKNY